MLKYKQVQLLEDFLSGEECLEFASVLQSGKATMFDLELARAESPQWSAEFVPLANLYMSRAGHVVTTRLCTASIPSVGALMSSEKPYYPSWQDAARHWFPYPANFGARDGWQDQVVFLLPETRAYLADAQAPEEGFLEISVAGTEVAHLSLFIKGAYWQGNAIRHFEIPVQGKIAGLAVPDEVRRLEYVLVDSNGVAYDRQREDRFVDEGLGRRRLQRKTDGLVNEVRQASLIGENQRIEFKASVEPEQQLVENHQETKLHELICAMAAFANTDGGTIYVGVDKHCIVLGIDSWLKTWSRDKIRRGEDPLDRFIGALRSRINDSIEGEVNFTIDSVKVDGATVVVIKTAPAQVLPVTVRYDRHLYVRIGPNNSAVHPGRWRDVLDRGPLYQQDIR